MHSYRLKNKRWILQHKVDQGYEKAVCKRRNQMAANTTTAMMTTTTATTSYLLSVVCTPCTALKNLCLLLKNILRYV